ncbi:hypothetical protein AAMO2058_001694500 [Amorphochlora amoebiformis]
MNTAAAETAERAYKRARKAWRSDKENTTLRKAYRKAKKAYEALKQTDDSNHEAKIKTKKRKKADADKTLPAKKKKKTSKKRQEDSDLKESNMERELKTAVKRARKAYKANKEDKSLRKALKLAKKALLNLQESKAGKTEGPPKSQDNEASPDTPKTDANPDPSTSQELKVGDTCEATYSDGSWYKAKILDISEGKVKVEYEGYGETAEVEQGDIRMVKVEEVYTRKLFVGNLSYDVVDEKVIEFFNDCGKISEIHWVCNTTTGRFSGMGFVTFETDEGAKKAVEKHETEFLGRRIKLRFAKPRKERPQRIPRDRVARRPVKPLSERPDECYTVFVGNLSYDVNEEKMTKFAEEKSGGGAVTAVRWITDRDTGDFKGAGYIEFESTKAVDEFVKQNGQVFMNRQLRVDYATPKSYD